MNNNNQIFSLTGALKNDSSVFPSGILVATMKRDYAIAITSLSLAICASSNVDDNIWGWVLIGTDAPIMSITANSGVMLMLTCSCIGAAHTSKATSITYQHEGYVLASDVPISLYVSCLRDTTKTAIAATIGSVLIK